MTIRNELDEFRIFAKRLSRKHQIRHHDALDIMAKQQGHSHWKALMKAWDQGWRPDPWDIVDINESSVIESPIRGFDKVKTTQGDIAGEPYTLRVYFDDVLVSGNGWGIHLGHAPSEPAKIEKHASPNPLDDKAFFSQVMQIAMKAADGGGPRRQAKPCVLRSLFCERFNWRCRPKTPNLLKHLSNFCGRSKAQSSIRVQVHQPTRRQSSHLVASP